MPARWKVYRNNELIGELTSAEIRQRLREGALDPFDQVSREASSVRMEILDVDEIFQESRASGDSFSSNERAEEHTVIKRIPSPKVELAPRNPLLQAQEDLEPAAPRPKDKEPRPAAEPEAPTPPQSSLRTPFVAQLAVAHEVHEPKKIKEFYLVDKQDRRLGPLSAAEIQSLFQRGILEPKLLVQKMGQIRKTPLRQFLRTFAMKQIAEARAMHPSGHKNHNGPQQGYNVSAVVNQMHKSLATINMMKRQRALYYALVLLLGIIMGLGTFFAVEIRKVKKQRNEMDRQEELESLNRSAEIGSGKHAPALALKRNPPPAPVRANAPAQLTTENNKEIETPTKTANLPPHESRARKKAQEKALKLPQKPLERPVAKAMLPEQPKPPVPPAPPASTVAPPRLPPERNGATEQPRVAPKPVKAVPRHTAETAESKPHVSTAAEPTAPASATPKKESPLPPSTSAATASPAAAASAGGAGAASSGSSRGLAELAGKGVITTSQVHYSVAALQQCPLKCSLIFTYSNGESFTGLFFKGAFAEQLASKGGSARLTGKPKQKGKSFEMIIQNIQ